MSKKRPAEKASLVPSDSPFPIVYIVDVPREISKVPFLKHHKRQERATKRDNDSNSYTCKTN